MNPQVINSPINKINALNNGKNIFPTINCFNYKMLKR